MTDPVVPAAVPAQPVPVPPAPAQPGMSAPVPMPPAQAQAVQPAPLRRRNTVGIGAFIFGLLAFLSPAIGVVGGFAAIGRAPSMEGLDFFNVLFYGAIGAGVGCVVALVALVLGFISLAIKNAKRMWGILGLVLGFIAMSIGWIPLFAFLTTLGGTGEPTGVPING